MHVIRHQMPLLDAALPLYCQSSEYLAEVRAQLPVQRLAPVLGDEDQKESADAIWSTRRAGGGK